MKKGIYHIINIINKKVYIGQSKNMAYRIRKHKEMLRGNRHPKADMQQDYNELGDSAFVYGVTEECEDLDIKEKWWCEHYMNETDFEVYNIAIGRTHSESTKQKLREYNLLNPNQHWLGKKRER